MGNLRLQFQHETAKHVHFEDGQESGVFENMAIAGNSGKCPVEIVERLICSAFSSKMVSSHDAPPSAFWLGARPLLTQWRVPLRLISGQFNCSAGYRRGNAGLGHYPASRDRDIFWHLIYTCRFHLWGTDSIVPMTLHLSCC